MIKKIITLLKFDKKNRTQSLKINLFLSYISKIFALAISFLLVPLTINYVNSTNYGIWLTLSSIVSWFSFFDIGFGNGMRNKFSESKAQNDIHKAKVYVSTTYIIVFIIFFLVWLIFFLMNFYLDWPDILNAPKNMHNELFNVVLIVITGFCMQMVLRLITTVLLADQRSGFASLIELLCQISTIILIVILKYFTKGSLTLLALALTMPAIIVYIISSIYLFSNEYKIYFPKVKLYNKSVVVEIFKLGSQFFVTQITMLIIYATSNIIITQNLNPKDVTTYNIAYRYFSVVMIMFSIMMPSMWSAFTEAWAKKDIKWIKTSLNKMMKIWLYFIILSVIMLIVSNFIYKIWVGKMILIPFTLSFTLSIFSILSCWTSIWGNFLNGVGKIRLQTYVCIIKCIVYFPLAIILINKMGLVGISLSFIIINLPDMIFYPIQARKILQNRAEGLWNS